MWKEFAGNEKNFIKSVVGSEKKRIFASDNQLSNIMYKSRAVPTLTGENAEYFREIQEKMEHTEVKENWLSVGEGVKTMMRRAGSEAWGI